MQISVVVYPSLAITAFETRFPVPLADLPSPVWLTDGLRLDAEVPLQREEAVRTAVRDLLRQRGYKPTGRGKPASEYLVKAAEENTLGSINAAVDACNVASLHSGFPISVVDLDRAAPPFRVDVAGEGDRYVFNASGQEIELSGLLCLFDAEGPCANAVRDSQRTKTHAGTAHTLSVVWGVDAFADRLREATEGYRGLLHHLGATTESAELVPAQ